MTEKEAYKKLMRLCIIQIISQEGFVESSERALSILTDVTFHIFEKICEQSKTLTKFLVNTEKSSNLLCDFLVEKYFPKESFEYSEFKAFLKSQDKLNQNLEENCNGNTGADILEKLNILSKNFKLNSEPKIEGDLKNEEILNEGINSDDIKFVEENFEEMQKEVNEKKKEFNESTVSLNNCFYKKVENKKEFNGLNISFEKFWTRRENLRKEAILEIETKNYNVIDILSSKNTK